MRHTSEYIAHFLECIERDGRAFIVVERDTKNSRWNLRGPNGELVAHEPAYLACDKVVVGVFKSSAKLSPAECVIDMPNLKVWEVRA